MKVLDRPDKVRTSLDELEVLSRLKESVEWAIVKRMATRYVQNLRKASFKLMETNPNYLAVRHAEFAGQALGIKTLIKIVDESNKRRDKLEKNRK
jgi:hypothetical protein